MSRTVNGMYLFFSGEDPLSNFYIRDFVVKGITFRHSEQFLMYCKAMLFNDLEIAAKILKAVEPLECKRLGRQVRGFNQGIWVTKREHYDYMGNLHKFQQHPDIADFLLNTGDLELVEASKYDTIWGVGLDEWSPAILHKRLWLGLNLHGKAIMRVRDELRRILPLRDY